MIMAFGGFHARPNSAPMAEINVIPLVDIMLVLLVIFIVTAPLLTHAVKIDLPRETSAPNLTKPENVQLAIDGSGQVYWNGEPVSKSVMIEHMQQAGRESMAPELHLHVDKATRYEVVADVMSEAGKAGLNKIGFVTDPRTGS